VVGSDLVDEAPILDLRVRKAVRRNGAQLVTLSARPSTLDVNAAAALRHAPGAEEAALAGLAAALGSTRATGGLDDLAARARAGAGSLRAAAEVLSGAGDVIVIWGERLWAGERGKQAADALLAVAAALGLPEKAESGLIGIPESTNGRGLREVGCLPGIGPGLSEAAEPGELEDAKALLLVDADQAPEAVLERPDSLIAFARFRSEALERHAGVVFPAEIYAEKEGTVTHPDGRVQRLRQALGHAGEVRPGWHVLSELCERVGLGAAALSLPQVTAEMVAAVPFYGGLTLEEIGGRGVRWQDRDAAGSLALEELPATPLAEPPAAPAEMTLATAPTLWAGGEVEHSRALSFLAPSPHAELAPEDARTLGIRTGDALELSVAGDRAEATARVRTGVPAGSVFVTPPGVLPDGPVEVSPARERAEAGIGAQPAAPARAAS
jgi:NADH-quinone oxidoreductase subunit G